MWLWWNCWTFMYFSFLLYKIGIFIEPPSMGVRDYNWVHLYKLFRRVPITWLAPITDHLVLWFHFWNQTYRMYLSHENCLGLSLQLLSDSQFILNWLQWELSLLWGEQGNTNLPFQNKPIQKWENNLSIRKYKEKICIIYICFSTDFVYSSSFHHWHFA